MESFKRESSSQSPTSTQLKKARKDGDDNARQQSNLPCQRATVSPTIRIDDPKIVLVNKPYLNIHPHPHRLAVRLGTDSAFTGTGTLSCDSAANIRLFDATNTRINLPQTIAGNLLSAGVDYSIEGASPSADMNTTILSLSLEGGDKTILNSPARDSLTCVEVFLDLCEYKPATGGADPAPVADKINTGRNLHLQTVDWYAGRGLLIVRRARPHSFTGQVVLTAQNAKVRTFEYANEVPAAGQAAQTDPLLLDNAAIPEPGGLKLWVEGAAASAAMRDTGFKLGLAVVLGVDGDRANITVVKAVVDVYSPATPPVLIADGAKMNPGRAVHVQNTGNEHKRAKLKVCKVVEPGDFIGNLELTVWDKITKSMVAPPRLKLYDAEAPGGAAHPNPHALNHDGAYPALGKELWAEGAVLSDDLHDTEIRLRVADAEGSADRAAFTVHQLFVTEIKFNGIREIWYARIPVPGAVGVSYILPVAVSQHQHFSPVEERPAAGKPHWKKKPATDPDPEFSWPAVYVRQGATLGAAAKLEAKFELHPPGTVVDVPIEIKSVDGIRAGIRATEQMVNFTNGKSSSTVKFTLLDIPAKVRRLHGIELKWCYDGGLAHQTKHTLFIVDETPKTANNGWVDPTIDPTGNVIPGYWDDKFLWEIFEWACGWADGFTGHQPVLDAIWGQFQPARTPHATGLEYWKNYQISIKPAQDLVTAIQSQDDLNPLQQNAASCIVFDRVFINCLAAHGIASAEIMLNPSNFVDISTIPPTTYGPPFNRGSVNYHCEGWAAKRPLAPGQGNTNPPPSWGSHWIADVAVPGAPNWKLYDPSYGARPVDSNEPNNPGTVNTVDYEPGAVQEFNCYNPSSRTFSDLPPDPAQPPHLVGTVLWTNKP
jgi:hypothetical protein